MTAVQRELITGWSIGGHERAIVSTVHAKRPKKVAKEKNKIDGAHRRTPADLPRGHDCWQSGERQSTVQHSQGSIGEMDGGEGAYVEQHLSWLLLANCEADRIPPAAVP